MALQVVVYGVLRADHQPLRLMAVQPVQETVVWIESKASHIQHFGVVQNPHLRVVGRLGFNEHFVSGQLPEQAAFLSMA